MGCPGGSHDGSISNAVSKSVRLGFSETLVDLRTSFTHSPSDSTLQEEFGTISLGERNSLEYVRFVHVSTDPRCKGECLSSPLQALSRDSCMFSARLPLGLWSHAVHLVGHVLHLFEVVLLFSSCVHSSALVCVLDVLSYKDLSMVVKLDT